MVGALLDAPSTQGRSSSDAQTAQLHMKNFVRLVRLAWPHRSRFVLSIACAAMVALFYFTELAAVLPLLNILFKSENPQRWISTKVDDIGTRIILQDAQAEEIQKVREAAERGDTRALDLARDYQRLDDESDAIRQKLKDRQHAVDMPDLKGLTPQYIKKEQAEIDGLQKHLEVVDGRIDELRKGSTWLKAGDLASIRYRQAQIAEEKGRRAVLAGPIPAAKADHLSVSALGPLPESATAHRHGHLGGGHQGLLHVPSRSPRRRRDAADPVRYPQSVFPPHHQPRPGKLLRSGLRRAHGAVHQRYGLVWSGSGHPAQQVDSRADARLHVPEWRALPELEIDLPDSCCGADLGTDDGSRRADHEARHEAALESMSSLYKILQESFQGIKVVKAFAMERVERRRFFIETKNFYRKAIRVAMIDAMSDPVLEMLTLVTVAIALLAGSYLVLKKTIFLQLGPFQIQLASQVMAIEELLTLYAVLAGASDPIRKLSNVHSKLQRGAAAADRICAMMDRAAQGGRTSRSNRAAPASTQAHRVS